MSLPIVIAIAAAGWVVALALVFALCRAASRGDEAAEAARAAESDTLAGLRLVGDECADVYPLFRDRERTGGAA